MVSANEDLMREHGLLQRMLLIYDNAIDHMQKDQAFDPRFIYQTARIIRDFVEDYHEKLEEEFLFPRLKKTNKEVQLVTTLEDQHSKGRLVTEEVLNLTKPDRSFSEKQTMRLLELLIAFNRMYRPHEAREDTVLFPAFKELVSKHEYGALGEDFEKKEHEKFGKDGFFGMVDRIAEIEKQIGIYDLNNFTPHV